MTNNKSVEGRIKLLYLIASIVFAVVLWAYVSYVNNDIEENYPFHGIDIVFLGRDRLTNSSQ